MFLTLPQDPLQKTVMTVLGSTAQFLNVSKIKEEVINNAYLTAIVISIFQDLSHYVASRDPLCYFIRQLHSFHLEGKVLDFIRQLDM